jgi:predicted outer membrane protein
VGAEFDTRPVAGMIEQDCRRTRRSTWLRRAGGAMRVRLLVVVVVLALAACSPPGAPPIGAPQQPGADVGAERRAEFGRAHRSALALLGLGALGAERASTPEIRALAARLEADGRALDDRLRALATAQGVALGDPIGAGQQGVLADLQERTGRPFDAAWTRAVLDLHQQVRATADAVLASSAGPADALAGARDALAGLDATVAGLR